MLAQAVSFLIICYIIFLLGKYIFVKIKRLIYSLKYNYLLRRNSKTILNNGLDDIPKEELNKINDSLQNIFNDKKINKLLLNSTKPYIKINKKKGVAKRWQSKFGGEPYFPKNFPYPKNSQGEYMYLLAQINFEEMPNIQNFPKNGILQFFVSPISHNNNICTYGLNARKDDRDFKVIYFENIQKQNLLTDFSFLLEINEKNFPGYSPIIPIEEEYIMVFKKEYAPISVGDYRFFDFFKLNNIRIENHLKSFDTYSNSFKHDHSKIGGYPSFRQHDPRECYENLKMDFQPLFMIGEDFNSVTACSYFNFFITQQDLKRKNFNNVLGYMDNT